MLSLPKILLLAVIVAAVVFGTRLLRGRAKADGGNGGESEKSARSGDAVTMSACPVCGDYVDPSSRGCGRGDCPYG
jgi:hypothetical protein